MIGVVLLPQLLFFWLAPQDAAARWAVYIVGTVLTFLLTCMSFGVCWYVGVRRGAAMAAVSGGAPPRRSTAACTPHFEALPEAASRS